MTNTTQHTPGPWTFERNPNTAYTFNIYADGIRVAEVLSGPSKIQKNYFGDQYVDLDNATDGANNARLIAAAPELLEALEWMVEYVAQHPDFIPDDQSSEAQWFDDARAAIAKARGQT